MTQDNYGYGVLGSEQKHTSGVAFPQLKQRGKEQDTVKSQEKDEMIHFSFHFFFALQLLKNIGAWLVLHGHDDKNLSTK